MRMLIHENGFIMISKIGAITVGEPYGHRARCFVKVDGENLALFAPDESTLRRRIRGLTDVMLIENKGGNKILWEEL